MKRIVLMRGGGLGDFILGLPLLDTLLVTYPDAHVTVIGPAAWLPLAQRPSDRVTLLSLDHPAVRGLYAGVAVPGHAVDVSSRAPEGMAPPLRDAGLVLLLFATPDPVVTSAWAASGAQEVRWYPPFPAPGQVMHATDHLLGLAAQLGCAHLVRVPDVFLSEAEQTEADSWLLDHVSPGSGPLVALHPGSGGRWKCWPAGQYGQLAARLAQDQSARLLLVSGPADGDLIAQVRQAAENTPMVALRNQPVRMLAAMLSRCDLFVGNDTGVTHLAAATGCPTLALFGPTDDRVWAPRGNHVRVLRGVPSPAFPPQSRIYWLDRPREDALCTEFVFHCASEHLLARRLW